MYKLFTGFLYIKILIISNCLYATTFDVFHKESSAIKCYDNGKFENAINELKDLTFLNDQTAFFAWLNISIIEFERGRFIEANDALNNSIRLKLTSSNDYINHCKLIIRKEENAWDKSLIKKLKDTSDPIEKLLIWQFVFYKFRIKFDYLQGNKETLYLLKQCCSSNSLRFAKTLSKEAQIFYLQNEDENRIKALLESNRILEALNLKRSLLYVNNVESLFFKASPPLPKRFNEYFLKYEKDSFLNEFIKVQVSINYYRAKYFYNCNDLKQSQYYIEKAYVCSKNDPDILTFLAFICHERSEFKQAIIYYRKLRRFPKYRIEAYLGAGNCAYDLDEKKLNQYYSSLIIKDLSNGKVGLNLFKRIIKYFYRTHQFSNIEKLNMGILVKHSKENPKGIELGTIYNFIGTYLWQSQKYDKALEQYQLAILSTLPYENRKDIYADLNYTSCNFDLGLITYLKNKGEAFYQLSKTRKNKKEEIRDLKECFKNLNLSIEQMYKYKMKLSTEEQKYLFSDLRSKNYPNIIKVCLELYNLTGDINYYHQAFRFAEQGRASIMLSMLRSNKGSKIGLIPEKYKALEDSINLQISLLNEKINGLKEESDAKYELNTQLDKLAAKRSDLEQIYKKQYPSFYNLKYSSEVVNPEYFQKTLSNNECVIEFLLNRNFLISYYIDRKNLIIKTDTLKTVNLAQLADRFYNQTSHFNLSQFKPDSVKLFAENAQKLYQILLKPFEENLHGKKLIIVADNSLRKIPFEVLLTENPKNYQGYKDMPYLIKKNPVYYAPSITLLNELRSRPVLKRRAKLLAIAPVYSSLKLNDTVSRMLLAVRSDTSVFGSLPNAKKEIMFANSIAGGKYLTGKTASETRFKRIVGDYDIVHLATHGILNNDSSLQSNLLFADSQPEDDGFLHNYEIYNLKQSSQLVILSACNTGAGKNYGGEGIISTGRGFLSSGSRSVIMTLWPVNDLSSYELIKGFYEGLKKGMPICNALRQSKLSYLEEADNMHSHPYFWTGYITYGDASIPLSIHNYRNIYIILSVSILVAVAIFIWIYRKA